MQRHIAIELYKKLKENPIFSDDLFLANALITAVRQSEDYETFCRTCDQFTTGEQNKQAKEMLGSAMKMPQPETFTPEFVRRFNVEVADHPQIKQDPELVEKLQTLCSAHIFDGTADPKTPEGKNDIVQNFATDSKIMFSKRYHEKARAAEISIDDPNKLNATKRLLRAQEEGLFLTANNLLFKNMLADGFVPSENTVKELYTTLEIS